jgi:hypothetical protein
MYVAVTRSLVRRRSQLQTWLDKSNKLNLQENFLNGKIKKGYSQMIILNKELITRTVVHYTHVLHKIMRTSLSNTIITFQFVCVCFFEIKQNTVTKNYIMFLCTYMYDNEKENSRILTNKKIYAMVKKPTVTKK